MLASIVVAAGHHSPWRAEAAEQRRRPIVRGAEVTFVAAGDPYAIANGRRALMGISRSTVGALDGCVNGGIHFDACALVAPAIAPAHFPAVLPKPRASTRFLLATGTYDIPLIADARALRDELQRRRLSVQYSEQPHGHNHTAFRAALPELMRALFPGTVPLQ